ncbi:MAG: endolytic transglycosylase MltG [Chitinispirillaceae bacterium]|nr:endolytic transglycosylase MltG [Chitinispirillaceae bacterium]
MQRKPLFLALTILSIVFIIVGSLLVTGKMLFLPFRTSGHPVEVIIEQNMSLYEVATILKKRGVIRSPRALIAWMRFKKTERSIQAGLVTLHQGDGAIRAADKLLHATPLEISIMVPEGLTIEQTAYHIRRSIPIDTTRFIAICYDSTFIAGFSFGVPSLEGYLFPDTYRLPKDFTERDLIKRMVANHQKTWQSIEIDEDIAKKFTHHQLVTLASIVEREATLIAEQPRISGVFHNRLRLGDPLGADPTVRFALKRFGGPLRVSELNCNSPYNTRRFPGLPPGPICSPGKGALAAAAKPLATDELFFVAKWDGSGEHDFSVTNAEHDRKKLEIRRRNNRRLKRKGKRGK